MMKLAAIAFLIWPFIATSTTFYVKPFPDAVEGAPEIVRAEIVSNQGRWASRSGRRQIYTYTKLKVLRVYKGSIRESEIDVRQPGGEVDGVGLQVPGTSKFKNGEELILFLNRQNSDGSYDVKGMMLGRLNIERNAAGEEVLSGPAIQWQGQTTSGHEHENSTHDQDHDDTSANEDSSKRWSVDDLVELINKQKDNKKDSEAAEPRKVEAQTENKQIADLPKASAPPLQKQEGGGSMEEFSSRNQNQTEEEANTSLWPLWTLFFVSIFVVLFVLKR